MKNKIIGVCKPALLGMAFGGLVPPALAAGEFMLSAGAGLEIHDNAGLSSTDAQSDTKRIVNTNVGYLKTDGEVTVDLAYNAEYGDYLHNVQSDQTSIDGHTALKWLIAPHQLDAVLYHQISQQLTDSRGLNVASNRQERSVITTGFDGFLHLSGVDSVVLSPRFSDVNFQNSSISNSQRSSVSAAWDHKTSPVSALDLTASYDHATFNDSQNDYNSPGVLLSYHTSLSRLSYLIGVGASRIDRDAGADVTGSTINANIDYRGEEGRDWGASYVHQLTDTSIGLSGMEIAFNNFTSNDSNSNQFDIITEDKADAYWRDRINPANLLSLGVGYQKEVYKATPLDESIAYAQAGYQYTINSRWSTGIDGRYERDHFLDTPTDQYNITRIYLNAIYRPLRVLEIRFAIGQDKREADTSTLNYTDKVVMMGFKYRIF